MVCIASAGPAVTKISFAASAMGEAPKTGADMKVAEAEVMRLDILVVVVGWTVLQSM